MMAAGVAASAGKKTLLVEKMEKPGRKVRITGKGRCNLTNACERGEFLAKVRTNADFFATSFALFDNQATIDFFRNEGVKIAVERGGRVFPDSGKAHDIANALADWATESGAEVMLNTDVISIRTLGDRVNGVRVKTKRGFERVIECDNVILCTGGASYPATGSTGDGYGFAHTLGHRIEEVRPALTSLQSRSALARDLNGLKLKNVAVKLEIDGEGAAEEFGEMEFGSRGLEGAVILRLSRRAVDALIDERQVAITLDLKAALTPEVISARIDRETEELGDDGKVSELLRKLMPQPMMAPFAKEAGVGLNMPLARLEAAQKESIIATLKCLRIPVDDYGPFDMAVVTAGGVDVSEVDPATMQSKLVRGLYFAGEVLDIDADTGGYNLQVAFSTGHLAGQLKK